MSLFHKQRGFTLIEMIVVISIIALLISLLLPVLSGARNMSRQIQCSSNQRQLTLAGNMYADDSNGYLPTNGWRHRVPPLGELLPYLNLPVENNPLHNEATVLTCPILGQIVEPQSYNPTYTKNQMIDSAHWSSSQNQFTIGTWMLVRRLESMPIPSQCYFFMDGVQSGQSTAGTRYGWTVASWESSENFQFPHNDGMVIGYVDGHVSIIQDEDFLNDLDANSPAWRGGVTN